MPSRYKNGTLTFRIAVFSIKEVTTMSWDMLNIIGTIAFAISGAIVAMEEEYDIFGVYLLGFATAFGGGAVRNLLIGVPITALWQQNNLFHIAIITMTILFIFPHLIKKHWERFGDIMDAMGLAAFAIQGAIYAVNMDLPLSAVIVAAVLTGTGGGLIRDILAGRKPLVLRDEIYALWAIVAAIALHFELVESQISMYILTSLIIGLRMISIKYQWKLPKRLWTP